MNKHITHSAILIIGIIVGGSVAELAQKECQPQSVIEEAQECTIGQIDNQILSNYAAMKCESIGGEVLNVETPIVTCETKTIVVPCDCDPDYDNGYDDGYSAGVKYGEELAQMYTVEVDERSAIERANPRLFRR